MFRGRGGTQAALNQALGDMPLHLSSELRPGRWLRRHLNSPHWLAAEMQMTLPQLLALSHSMDQWSTISVCSRLLTGTYSEISSTTAEWSTPFLSKSKTFFFFFALDFSPQLSKPKAIPLCLSLFPTSINYVLHLHCFYSCRASWFLEGKTMSLQ